MGSEVAPQGPRFKTDRLPLASGGGLILFAVIVAVLPSIIWPASALSAYVAATMAACCGMAALIAYRATNTAANRLEKLVGENGPGGARQRLDRAVEVLEQQAHVMEQRWGQSHRVTGLATREPLLAQIEADGAGTLGVIAFVDFDRVCAFDPALSDRMLRELAGRVRRMVGRGRLLAHVDRSHFALWFGPGTDAEGAQAELAAISYALGSPIYEDGREFLPETCFRHGQYSKNGELPQALLAQLISACAASRSPLPGNKDVSAAAVRDQYTIEQDLRGAIQSGQLEMHYQPQIDSVTGQLSGAEALLRWNHPVRGNVSPALFIPIVEAAGLIDEFGLWALNAACREASRWRATGVGELRVAVNVSSQQLDRPDMLNLIERTLVRHALPSQALEIELTESAATRDLAKAGELFDALRSRGIEIAIDDFGTGFSSLTALRTLSFDKIKIDREFVTEVDKRRDSRAICQSVIALGRGLGIRVLAEGVERFEEYAWLRQHGCTEFQGFYFSQPLTGDDFQTFASNPAHLDALLDLGPRAAQNAISQRLA